MKEEQVTAIMYITDDGKRFDNLKSAQEHEKHLETIEKLNTFKIDGPNYTPFDECRALAFAWKWYKVQNQDEFDQVLRLITEAYDVESSSYCLFKDCVRFPEYICVSYNHKRIHTLTTIEKVHEMEMEKWEKFYQFFKNDLKK